MKWWRKKKDKMPTGSEEAREARVRAQKDKERVQENWIDVHQTLAILKPNGFGRDIRDAMRSKR